MTALFVTGSDTDVGKTIFSALLLKRARELFSDVKYIKPVQSGPDRDAPRISSLVNNIEVAELITLKRPLSPHIAAFKQNTRIDFWGLVKNTQVVMTADFNVVEGAGGLFVPIDGRHLVIDLIDRLRLPIVLVVRSSLGTINHTLLSLAALRARHIPVAGVVMIGKSNSDTEMSIKHYGALDAVFSLPWLSSINQQSIADLSVEHQSVFDYLIKRAQL